MDKVGWLCRRLWKAPDAEWTPMKLLHAMRARQEIGANGWT